MTVDSYYCFMYKLNYSKTYLSRQQIIFYDAMKRPLSLSLLIRSGKMNYSLAASVHITFLRHTFHINKYTNMNKTCTKEDYRILQKESNSCRK